MFYLPEMIKLFHWNKTEEDNLGTHTNFFTIFYNLKTQYKKKCFTNYNVLLFINWCYHYMEKQVL